MIIDTRYEKVNALLAEAGFSFEERRNITGQLTDMGFFKAPASCKHHLAYEGGLADHSINVCKELVQLTKDNGVVWKHIRSPYVVGLLHDICKCDSYIEKRDEVAGTYEYNKNCLLTGHGDKSAIQAQMLLELTEEEICCIRYHMGAYYKADWEGYDAAIKKYPAVLWTHHADMIASKLIEK